MDTSIKYVRFKEDNLIRPCIGYDSMFEQSGAYGIVHTPEEVEHGLCPIEWYSDRIVEPVSIIGIEPDEELLLQITDHVHTALRETFEEVREPGKSALVIPLAAYAQGQCIDANILRQALLKLQEQKRIHTRKLDYPTDIPEHWQIVFTEGE